MKNLLMAFSACVLMACVPTYDEPTIPILSVTPPIQEHPEIDGNPQHEFEHAPKIWVDKHTGCQYWVFRGRHAGRLAMTPRYVSKGVVAGCRGD